MPGKAAGAQSSAAVAGVHVPLPILTTAADVAPRLMLNERLNGRGEMIMIPSSDVKAAVTAMDRLPERRLARRAPRPSGRDTR